MYISKYKVEERQIARVRATSIPFFQFLVSVFALLVGNVSHAEESVQMELKATIEESCALSRTGSDPDAGSFGISTDSTFSDSTFSGEAITLSAQDGTVSVGFKVDCTSPFRYSLTSTNGALINTSGQAVSNDSDVILTRINYKTTFEVELEDGDKTSISQECLSEPLSHTPPACDASATPFDDSGTAVAIDKDASLTISIDGDFSDGLLNGVPILSGKYTDKLVLKVETPL